MKMLKRRGSKFATNYKVVKIMDAITGLLGDFDLTAIIDLLMSLVDTLMSLIG